MNVPACVLLRWGLVYTEVELCSPSFLDDAVPSLRAVASPFGSRQEYPHHLISSVMGELSKCYFLTIMGQVLSLVTRGSSLLWAANLLIACQSGSTQVLNMLFPQDDVMMPQRVRLQHQAAEQHPTSVSATPTGPPPC